MASSPTETARLHNGTVGFRIPEYQRQYDWSEENITRLYTDCLSGFYRLATGPNADAFTFLGTLVLVEKKSKETDFGGTSVDIVDGQQRLTTLTLIAGGLYEVLKSKLTSLASLELSYAIKQWLETEINERLPDLYNCIAGAQMVSGNKVYPYPRIVRTKDQRGRSSQTSEYRSPLAQFLNEFAKYASDEISAFEPDSIGVDTNARKLRNNYALIKRLLLNLNDQSWYESTECEQVPIAWLDRAGYKGLLDRLPDVIKDTDEQQRSLSAVKKYNDAHGLIRTLLFAAYFSRCIVLTRVSTDDESAAFDIFDALNTTGEPLTALETLKPRVIQYEDSKGDYAGTHSDMAFQRLSRHIDDRFQSANQKQKETKELIVNFALYMEGIKQPEHLAAQRNFLRTTYDKSAAVSPPMARRFVSLLADMAEFRWYYWSNKSIGELGLFHPDDSLEQVKFLVSFIRQTQSKLVLPILARYWSPNIKNQGDGDFLSALKAVSAFLILRRAASGGTAGIDSDFRSIMAARNGSSKRYGLCAGVEKENQLLSIDQLKSALKKILADGDFKIEEKDRWVDQVVDNPIYRQARTVARIMLLAAGHQSVPSKVAGCWERDGVKVSTHVNNFLNSATWHSELYETVEHVAPETEPQSGWDSEIYRNVILRHSLGNLVLLPKKENGAIGNDSWKKKKLFYSALTESTSDKQQRRIQDANNIGMKFSNYTVDLLKKGERLVLLQPLRDVKEWNTEVIRARARNTAELTWDYFWPWLS